MRVVLTLALIACLFTPQVRSALGLHCTGCPASAAVACHLDKRPSRCDCCNHSKPDRQEREQPQRLPVRCDCGAWCCGGGYVPLTQASVAPAPEMAPELASLLQVPSAPDGNPFRLEDPPRLG